MEVDWWRGGVIQQLCGIWGVLLKGNDLCVINTDALSKLLNGAEARKYNINVQCRELYVLGAKPPQFNVLVTPKIIFYIGLMVNPPDTQAI